MLLLAFAMLVGCGASSSNSTVAQAASMQQPVAAPIPHPSVPALPSELPVVFSHVPPGTYQVHLHKICSGIQGYHLAYLPDLVVGPAHTGQLLVPRSDFSRGWCVIVYADAVRNIVLVTQPI
jgi:hypothetical protein